MRFEWDQRKRRANLAAHGIDFADLESLFKGATITVIDDRYDYGEFRFITLGLLNGMVITVAHTETYIPQFRGGGLRNYPWLISGFGSGVGRRVHLQ
jgi:hypothetical protein